MQLWFEQVPAMTAVSVEIAYLRGRPRGLLDRFAKGSQQGRAGVALDGGRSPVMR